MRTIVVGCGRVGSGLAVALVSHGHQVTLIDRNPNSFRRMPAGWGGIEIVGSGFDKITLTEAGANQAHALAAVTSGDNSNILTARIAREDFAIQHVVARIYDPRRAEIYSRLGIPTIATVTWTIQRVIGKLFPEEKPYAWEDPFGSLKLVERNLPNRLCGKKLELLEKETGGRIVAVSRGQKSLIFSSDLIGQEGDLIHVAVDENAKKLLDEMLAEDNGRKQESR